MALAVLYDLHGNLPALEAVLDEVRTAGVDGILIGGDVVPGPMPRETIDCLRQLDVPTRFIRGNGDRAVLAVMQGHEPDGVPAPVIPLVRWVAEQLDADDEQLLASWPATCTADVDGIGEVLFCHATPRSDTEIFTRLTAEERLAPVFGGLRVPLVVCGHTHMPFDRRIGGVRVVNAGSVGMPFGRPGADWLRLGPGVELRHTAYDLAAAAARVAATRYPQAREFAARNILQPPSEADILQAYARVELT